MAGPQRHIIRMAKVSKFFEEDPRCIDRFEDAIESNNVKTMNFDGELLIIRGEVWASQRDRFYKVEIYLDNELSLQQATCTCPRGQFLCHYMAALALYAHYNVASTDVVCQWNQRQSKFDEVVTIPELYPLPTVKQGFQPLDRDVNEEDRTKFYNQLLDYGGAVGFTWLLRPEVANEEQIVPDIEEIIFSQEFIAAENQKEYLATKLKMSEDVIKAVAVATVGQAANSKWLLTRRHRLTASKFGRILAAIKRKSYPPSLFRSLAEDYNLEGVRAIQWGRSNEAQSIREFERRQGVIIQPSGIWLHECGFLGASPDGLVGDDCILEVKCPYKRRSTTSLRDDLKKEKKYIIQFHDEELLINEEHDYYHQIQGQLHFTGRQKAFLMIWTPGDSLIVEICKSEAWAKNIKDMENFYYNYYIKYISGELNL